MTQNCLNVKHLSPIQKYFSSCRVPERMGGGSDQDFEMALDCTRPGGRLTIVAMYENNVTLPLPSIYGKNHTIKFGGVDGTDCEEILSLIEQGKLDTTMLITHRYSFRNLKLAYELFEGRKRGVMKIALSF